MITHGWLVMTLTAIAVALLAACCVYVVLSPWRTLLAWVTTLGIQIDFGQVHVGLADALAIPLMFWAVLLAIKKPLRLTPIFATLLFFAGIFCTWANLV